MSLTSTQYPSPQPAITLFLTILVGDVNFSHQPSRHIFTIKVEKILCHSELVKTGMKQV